MVVEKSNTYGTGELGALAGVVKMFLQNAGNFAKTAQTPELAITIAANLMKKYNAPVYTKDLAKAMIIGTGGAEPTGGQELADLQVGCCHVCVALTESMCDEEVVCGICNLAALTLFRGELLMLMFPETAKRRWVRSAQVYGCGIRGRAYDRVLQKVPG